MGIAIKATYCEVEHPVHGIEMRDGIVYGVLDNNDEIEFSDLSNDHLEALIAQQHSISVIEAREIFKDPITDDGVKKSAKGLLRVDREPNGEYYLTDQVSREDEEGGELVPVFEDGDLLVDPTLAEIRARINENVLKQLSK